MMRYNLAQLSKHPVDHRVHRDDLLETPHDLNYLCDPGPAAQDLAYVEPQRDAQAAWGTRARVCLLGVSDI